MLRRPPIPTLTDTLFPYTTLFRSGREMLAGGRLTLPGASAIQFRPREGGLGGEYDRFRRSAGLVTPARRSNGAFALVDVQLRKLAFALRTDDRPVAAGHFGQETQPLRLAPDGQRVDPALRERAAGVQLDRQCVV